MKPTLVAAALVLVSVAGVVLLTGVTRKSGPKPGPVKATPVVAAAKPAVEPPPFPPLSGELWNLSNVDARLRLPRGWRIGSVGNDERLLRNEADPLDGNMNLLIMPNIFGFSPEELLQENTDELAANPDLKLEDRRELYVAGRKVLRFDYHGTPRGKAEAVRFVAVVWTRGKSQIVLTTTVRASLWSEVAADVDAALETLQIRWPVERGQ
jgi:hypothetical protein